VTVKTSLHEIKPYTTKDGSQVRELMHPEVHGNKKLSFAQAVIEPGCATVSHVHKTSEEIYHVVQGKGMMTLGEEQFFIGPGDTVCILPYLSHRVENTGHEPLIIYCCCAPPYSHGDTEMLVEMQ
jgi:mannose-6-phosphate isomerase-like protein (cupin superfamily)